MRIFVVSLVCKLLIGNKIGGICNYIFAVAFKNSIDFTALRLLQVTFDLTSKRALKGAFNKMVLG